MMRMEEFFAKLKRYFAPSVKQLQGQAAGNTGGATAEPEPSVYFSSIAFDKGEPITLENTDIVVIVGPNNAGKSRALRDLHQQVIDKAKYPICVGTFEKVGSLEGFKEYVRRYTYVARNTSNRTLVGEGFEIRDYELPDLWRKGLGDVSKLFCQLIATGNRISSSNAPESFALLNQAPKNPIHRLAIDDKLEHRLSKIFQSAFGKELILYRAGGSEMPLLVGKTPEFEPGEDRVSFSYLEKLRHSTVELEEQGDGMRSFASVMLYLLASETQSLFLVDEPEAFLHPPQARRIGELIASDRMRPSQVFVATHSPDVLTGLLSVSPEKLRIIRIDRDANDRTKATELPKYKVNELATDPVMKFSSVLNGLFHKRVIVCEADSDCLFYSSILELPQVNGSRHPDVLFLQVGGKDRMASLALVLKELGVEVDVVVDIDVFSSKATFERLVDSLGGSWQELSGRITQVEKAVEQTHTWLSAPQMVALTCPRFLNRS